MKSRPGYVWSVLLILIVSIFSLRSMPWAPHLGLDFQNLYAFHHGCGSPIDPYLRSGRECGDELGRGLYYPPLMYWSFIWTRLLPFTAAYALWVAFILASLGLAFRLWARPGRLNGETWPLWLIALLMIPQYPSVFALERGNNDAGVVFLWSTAFYLYTRGRDRGAGVCAALAALAKIYPVFSVLVLLAGGTRDFAARRLRPRESRAHGMRFAGGMAAAVALVCLLSWPATRSYALVALPRFSRVRNAPGLANHAVIPFFAPAFEWIGYLIAAIPLGLWLALSHRALRRDPPLLFAGALAISTYFSGVSEDYNLLTAYPLLFLLCARALREPAALPFYKPLSLFGFLAVLGHRQVFVGTSVFFQLAWLSAVAGSMLFRFARSEGLAAGSGAVIT